MKKSIFLLLAFFATTLCRADQLQYISKEQAQLATEFLSSQKEVLIRCACCNENNTRNIITLKKVYFEHSGFEDYYKVIVEGKNNRGDKVKMELDLAYVFFKIAKKAYNVGLTLGFKCDPCTAPFE